MMPHWNADQVASLNAFQTCGHYHPFTCTCREPLVAREDGWHCPQDCQGENVVVQQWAHAFMMNWSWQS